MRDVDDLPVIMHRDIPRGKRPPRTVSCKVSVRDAKTSKPRHRGSNPRHRGKRRRHLGRCQPSIKTSRSGLLPPPTLSSTIDILRSSGITLSPSNTNTFPPSSVYGDDSVRPGEPAVLGRKRSALSAGAEAAFAGWPGYKYGAALSGSAAIDPARLSRDRFVVTHGRRAPRSLFPVES